MHTLVPRRVLSLRPTPRRPPYSEQNVFVHYLYFALCFCCSPSSVPSISFCKSAAKPFRLLRIHFRLLPPRFAPFSFVRAIRLSSPHSFVCFCYCLQKMCVNSLRCVCRCKNTRLYSVSAGLLLFCCRCSLPLSLFLARTVSSYRK